MGDFKANGVIGMRKLIRAKGEETEKAFLAQLTPEEQKRYQTMVSISKLPIEEVANFSRIAASLLFPDLNEKEGLRKLGASGVEEDMNAALKVLLRFLNTETVIRQAAKVWSNVHSEGKAYCIKGKHDCTAEFAVEEYPDIPGEILQTITGYIIKLVELTGVRNVKVIPNFFNKDQWVWKISWTK